ncbi:MAG: YkgJ family cysteine cluster protein [Myxococcota bacterium]
MRTVTLDAAASPEARALLNSMLARSQDALRAALAGDRVATDRALDTAMEAYDAYRAHVVTAHPMACREGCTACCHDNPRGVTGIEIARLREVATVEEIARFRALAARGEAQETWRARREPCPFLVEGRCRVYARRPIACRAFYALTPPNQCDPGDPRYEERVNPHLDPPQIVVQILRAISRTLALGEDADLHAGIGR